MSDTPRTDALWDPENYPLMIEHARRLERELAAAIRERDEMKAEIAGGAHDSANYPDSEARVLSGVLAHQVTRADAIEAYAECLVEALQRTAIFAEYGGRARLKIIAYRCRLCDSGAVPEEAIPHQEECPLATAKGKQK